jgi:hypothetical protein
LFAGLRSFDEFERRVSALPTEKDRGDAFEVFAEAYLATQRKHDAAQIWPLPAAPLELLPKLGLATNDYGVDGLLQTTLGQLNVYQVKFRTDRQPLTWRELSTFMGLADSTIFSRSCSRTATNCANDERRGFCIRGSEPIVLKNQTSKLKDGWRCRRSSLQNRRSLTSGKHSTPCCLPCVNTTATLSWRAARKTLLSLWIAEQMGVSWILVLHRSRCSADASRMAARDAFAVVRLSLRLFRPHRRERSRQIATPQSELDFEVTTDSRSVREFLDAPFAG